MDINEVIGMNVQALRNKENLSIGQLAEKTGLSKAVISQIERGNANPTINTIWKLAGALHVPYSAVLEPRNVSAAKVAMKDLVPQEDDGGHYRISCYFPGTSERNFELFLLEFDPGAVHVTQGHTDRSQEYLVIKKGKLVLEVGSEKFALGEGDALYFDASGRHVYTNPGKTVTQAVCINYYPVIQ